MKKKQFAKPLLVLKKLSSDLPEFYITRDLEEAKTLLKKRTSNRTRKSEDQIIDAKQEAENFDSIIDGFVNAFTPYYRLASILPHIGIAMARVHIDEGILDKRDSFESIERHKDSGIFSLNESQTRSILETLTTAKDYAKSFEVVPASILMSVVSTFDAHLAGLSRFALLNNRKQIENSTRELKVVDIFKFSSFDELLENIVYEEIYKIMWESHQKQVSKLEELFSVKIKDHFDKWGEFIEVFERRNLVAHGEKFATERYFQNCRLANLSVDSERILSVGEKVSLSAKYIRISTDVLLLFLVIFAFLLRTKQEPKQFDEAYEKMNQIAFSLLQSERHTLAAAMLSIMVDWRNEQKDEEVHRMMIINLANAQRFADKHDLSKKTLARYQWRACSDRFKICEAAVRGDVSEVCDLMDKLKDDSNFGTEELRNWPVFHWVKDEKQFIEKFEDVFEEPYAS